MITRSRQAASAASSPTAMPAEAAASEYWLWIAQAASGSRPKERRAAIGSGSVTGAGRPVSASRRTSSVVAYRSQAVASSQFESPEITCSRRYRAGSACGSSRVLISGRARVVWFDTTSARVSKRWLIVNSPRCQRPAPANAWRLTRNGTSQSLSNPGSVERSTR